MTFGWLKKKSNEYFVKLLHLLPDYCSPLEERLNFVKLSVTHLKIASDFSSGSEAIYCCFFFLISAIYCC